MKIFFFSFFSPKSFAFYFVNDHPSSFFVFIIIMIIFRTKLIIVAPDSERKWRMEGFFVSIRTYVAWMLTKGYFLNMKKIMVRVCVKKEKKVHKEPQITMR